MKVKLDPIEPGLDEMTRIRRRTLAKIQRMSGPELIALAVRAGIYTTAGELTPRYGKDAEPSASRPKD